MSGLWTRTSEPRPGPHRQERQPLGRRLEAGLEHALVELDDLGDRAVLAGAGEQRLERDGVEGDEREHQPLDLAGGAEQADVGAAVGHDREVLQVGAQDRAHQGHRLAARAPAADADRHAVLQLGDDLLDRHPLVAGRAHAVPPLAPTKSSRSSSETPGEVELHREALLEAVALVDVDGVDAVERLLGGADDAGVLGRDLAGHGQRGVVERVAGDHLEHAAVGHQVGGGDVAAGEVEGAHQVGRHHAGQVGGGAQGAAVDLGHPEVGVVGGHDAVGVADQPDPAAEAEALDGGDHGHRALVDGLEGGEAALVGADEGVEPRGRLHLLDVDAGVEAAALGAQHHDVGGRVGGRPRRARPRRRTSPGRAGR